MKVRTTIYIEKDALEAWDKKAKEANISRSAIISQQAFGKGHNPNINNNQLDLEPLNERLKLFLKEIKSSLKDEVHNPDIKGLIASVAVTRLGIQEVKRILIETKDVPEEEEGPVFGHSGEY